MVNHGGGVHWPLDVLGLDETLYGRYAHSGVTRDEWARQTDSGPDLFEVGHDGPWLTVGSALRGAIEIRVIRVNTERAVPNVAAGQRNPAALADEASAAPVAVGPWHVRVGGYNLAGALEPECTASDTDEPDDDLVWSEVRGERSQRSQVVGLDGDWQPGHRRSHGANALGTWAACPTLTSSGPVTNGSLSAVAVVLTGSTDVTTRALPVVQVDRDGVGAAVTVTWPDGETDDFRLDPPPLPGAVS